MSNGKWYISTREGIDVGPYPSRDAAEYSIARLIAQLDGVTNPDDALKIVRQFLLLI